MLSAQSSWASAAEPPEVRPSLPNVLASSGQIAPVARESRASSVAASTGVLPRYLTIELRADGSWIADGERLITAEELELAVRRAAATGAFSGVAIFGDAAREGQRWHQLSEVLSRVGISPIRHAARPTPLALAALVRSVRPEASPGPAASSAAPEAERADSPSVTLSTVGLYVAGSANREANRRKLVATFERRFPEFERCHALARPHVDNASFGVDLLVPARGGKASVRQTRTRLRGDEFRACMLGAFGAISFEPPPTNRSEIVSYSVLFKPTVR